MWPKISVIIPVYNAQKTLKRCIDSVLLQDYDNYEIVLVDDGSTDSSDKICKKYLNENIKINYIRQFNSGPASARNTGIKNSTGDYIYFVDADDYIESNTLSTMIKPIRENNADMVICGYYQILKNKKIKKSYNYETGLYQGKELYNIAISFISDVKKNHIPPYSWIRMIRKDILTENNLKYEDGMIRSEDYYLFVQIHFIIERLFILSNEALYYYVDTDDSITHRYVENYWESIVKMYLKLKENLPKDQNIRKKLDIMLLQRSMIALNNSTRSNTVKQFKNETFSIIRDINIRNIAKSYSFSEGLNYAGLYFLLLKMKGTYIIYLRYYFKYIKNSYIRKQ